VGTVGSAAFHRIRLPDGPLAVGNLHLETPRSGFEALRYRASLAQLRRNKMFRDAGSARASQWLARLGAEIVAGDFNMPVESRIYRRYWTRCDNAFSRVGRGFGYTRVLYRFSIRIDHLLICSGWTAVGAQVGPDLASDHLPVIVDLRRR
jgi:vancomycin resistance protein VanJ